MEYYSPIKKNEIMPCAATWIDLEIVILSEVREEISYDIPCMWNLKRVIQMNLHTKQKEAHQLRKQTYGCGGGGIVRESGMDMYTLLYLKWITDKDLTVWHVKLDSMSYGSPDGRRVWGRMDTCICMAESRRYSPETITTLSVGYTPIQDKKF